MTKLEEYELGRAAGRRAQAQPGAANDKTYTGLKAAAIGLAEFGVRLEALETAFNAMQDELSEELPRLLPPR